MPKECTLHIDLNAPFHLLFAFPSSVMSNVIGYCFCSGFPFLINVGLFPKSANCDVVKIVFFIISVKKRMHNFFVLVIFQYL